VALRGAIIRAVIVGGIPNYRLQGVYYRQIPSGYVVVDAPSGEVGADTSMINDGARVTVTTSILNVRSGSGMNHSLVSRVNLGTVMTIRGQAEGRSYAEVPSGTFGWVMKVFTVPDSVSACGSYGTASLFGPVEPEIKNE
jgi:hypothetical protein